MIDDLIYWHKLFWPLHLLQLTVADNPAHSFSTVFLFHRLLYYALVIELDSEGFEEDLLRDLVIVGHFRELVVGVGKIGI